MTPTHPPEPPDEDDQMELVLRPLGDLDVGLGSAARWFYEWAEAWVQSELDRVGFVWTDDLHVAADAAGVKPPHDSLYGRFWSARSGVLGIKRTTDERTSRHPGSNGRKARRWVPE